MEKTPKPNLSHDVAPRSDIKLCNKIDKPLVVYRFLGNAMTSIITLRKRAENIDVLCETFDFKVLLLSCDK